MPNSLSRHTLYAALILVTILALPMAAQAQFHDVETPSTQAWSLYSAPGPDGGRAPLAVLAITMEPDWHIYAHEPGEIGRPTTLAAEIVPGNIPLAVTYPPGVPVPDTTDPSLMANVYEGTVRLYVPLPPDVAPPYTIQAAMTSLYCAPDRCLPGSEELALPVRSLDLATLPKAEDQPWWPEYAALQGTGTASEIAQPGMELIPRWNFTPSYLNPSLEVTGLPMAVLLGLLAGLILNVMPCVLPVISIKLTHLLGASNQRPEQARAAFRTHNIFFALGIVTFFAILACVLALTDQAWGALFQNPVVVLTLAGVVLLLALSLMGLFHLPVIDLKMATRTRNPETQAFFTGALTTLLATPCSGPLLGGVLGWALLQPSLIVLTVFLAIGVGMAAPYFLLAAFPGLARFLPRPGAWVELVEKFAAFLLLATALYLADLGTGGVYRVWLALLWAVPFAAWLSYRAMRSRTAPGKIALGMLAIMVAATTALILEPQTREGSPWEPFNLTAFNQALGKDTMFVEFSADWCPSCKALEQTVLTEANVAAWKAKYDVRFIKVDLTEKNYQGQGLLDALGSRSIPTSVIFSTVDNGRAPLVIRDLYTTAQIEQVLRSVE